MTDVSDKVKVVVSLEAAVDLRGIDEKRLLAGLEQRVIWAVGDGLLTGDSEVEVDEWKLKAEALDAEEAGLSQESVEVWFRDLMESGALSLEDVPKMLARYALSSEASARAELAERMGLAEVRE
jgi:hypothetical protein